MRGMRVPPTPRACGERPTRRARKLWRATGASSWKCAWLSATSQRGSRWTRARWRRGCGWPTWLPAEAFRSSDDVVGKKASSTILAGEVLSERRFRDAGSRLDVPEGLTALSVPAKDVQAVGGAVAAGSRVDVYATGGTSTDVLASGVLVLATSASAQESTNRREGVVDHCGRRARVGAGDRRGGAEDGAVLHVAGKRGRAMSGSLVALCADTTSLQHPESIGLAGENLAAQDWLRIFSSAEGGAQVPAHGSPG